MKVGFVLVVFLNVILLYEVLRIIVELKKYLLFVNLIMEMFEFFVRFVFFWKVFIGFDWVFELVLFFVGEI